MNDYSKMVEVRWSDLDPNFHLRHSVYYDWGAFLRMSMLTEHGLTAELMQQWQIGPVLFREECIFKKEIRFSDTIRINVKITKARDDMSRWSMQHEIWKNGDTLCAILHVDGAWMNAATRKLAIPPTPFKEVLERLPRAADFEWSED